MFQVVNWICYICVSFLVLEMMIYFCKDVIKMSKGKKNGKAKNVGNTSSTTREVIYQNKIAK